MTVRSLSHAEELEVKLEEARTRWEARAIIVARVEEIPEEEQLEVPIIVPGKGEVMHGGGIE